MYEPSPLRIKDPEFECGESEDAYALIAEVQISRPESGNKFTRHSTITFNTESYGGYNMKVALRVEGKKEWLLGDDVKEISIQFAGDYEANNLKQFFRHVGNMMNLVYGNSIGEADDSRGDV